MPLYKVVYNSSTKVARVQPSAAALPTGFADAGNFTYSFDPGEVFGVDPHTTFFHFVRDRLETIGIQDMQPVKIEAPRLTAVAIAAAPASVIVAQTRQTTLTFTPADAAVRDVTYVSSNPAIATVNATGLVTGVAVGSANITVTTVDGGLTSTVAITVTAT